jgi:hypothetical protein
VQVTTIEDLTSYYTRCWSYGPLSQVNKRRQAARQQFS